MLAVVATAATGCGAVAHKHPAAKPSHVPPLALTTTTTRTAPPSPQLTALAQQLRTALNTAGPDTSALVYDISAGEQLFALRSNIGRPPASVEKLYTSVAALDELGATGRLLTTVFGTGHLGAGGVWHGSLYLHGGGDPTFGDGAFNKQWEDGYGPTAGQLVSQLRARGIRRVTGHVFGDATLFAGSPGGPAHGYAPDIPDYGGELSALTYDHGATDGSGAPAAFATKELVLTMRSQGIAARAAAAGRQTPPRAVLLASVQSPPIAVLLKLMDVPSDDLFADMLAEQLGAQFAGAGTISAGARVIAKVVARYGVHPRIVDGSGLSRADRSSPDEVVALLRALYHTELGQQLEAALPVVGISGTVQGIAVRTPAQGRCVAKTGTLDDVSNLAGYCRGLDGHIIAFGLFLDGPENSQGLALIGQMVAAIAQY